MYTITNYTRRRARQLNVTVKRATNRNKKIDVYDKSGKKVASIGATGYNDYPTFWKLYGKKYASRRRIQYKRRHTKDRMKYGTPGYYADKLLW